MTDWEKLKVTELKEELKSRGIPLTGLKLKQQFIDKLNELDTGADVNTEQKGTESNSEAENNNGSANNPEQDAMPEGSEDASGTPVSSNHSRDEQHEPEVEVSSSSKNHTAQKHNEPLRTLESNMVEDDGDHKGRTTTSPPESSANGDRIDKLDEDLPLELKKEESQAQDAATPPPVVAETEAQKKAIQKDDPFIAQDARNVHEDTMDTDMDDSTGVAERIDQNLDMQTKQPLPESPKAIESATNTNKQASPSHLPTPEALDDLRKRKRRSATPDPGPEDIAHKRAKANDGTPIPTNPELEALKDIQKATDEAQAIRNPERQSFLNERDSSHSTEDQDRKRVNGVQANEKSQTKSSDTQRSRQPHVASRSPTRSSSDRDVSPAIHPATSSLYIRNFKRPLHIPTLRSHISGLAKSSDVDPIKVFYLDSIRTHAFVSFASISAASRVRNAMHGTRFPDEPMREALWIDFVPDEKVQGWIDEESGAGGSGLGGGRGSSRKYEVIYSDDDNGIEATLVESTSGNALPQRPGIQHLRSNRPVTHDSTAVTAATAVHPSRASLVPQSPTNHRSRDTRQLPPPRPSDPGKGFRALDELFSSTTTKPKLYYKLPPQTQIDDRLDMMRDLRVNHDQMGQSGDEGMKRYSFEKEERSGRDGWVDKGPEFGFGRRGQERLTGFGTSYGRGRGRGGFRGGRRGGDSWRGG